MSLPPLKIDSLRTDHILDPVYAEIQNILGGSQTSGSTSLMLLNCDKLQSCYHGNAAMVAILTNRGSDRAFRGSITRDLLNR